ncbi:MAG: hypothetical protein MJ168_06935 [Clostridia bacterium]|nr:hypothetical protein [Clostridia bacterium]
MKTFKKILAVLMIVVLSVSFAPTAFAGILPTSYNIWVCDTLITSINKADVFGDGTIKYDPETKTLTLTDAFIAASTLRTSGITVGSAYESVDILNIELVGDSYIYGKQNSTGNTICAGINCFYCEALNFKGDGTVTVKGYESEKYTPAGIYGGQGTTVNVESGKVTIVGKNFKYYSFTDDCRVRESKDSFVVTHKNPNPFISFFEVIGDFFVSIGNFFKNLFK